MSKIALAVSAAAALIVGTVTPASAQAAPLVKLQASVVPVTGDTRYETAAKLAMKGLQDGTYQTGGTVFIASGEVFADALAAAPAAAKEHAPILLALPNAIRQTTDDAMNALHPSRIIILGGEATFSDQMEYNLRMIYHWAKVDRIAGYNRQDTARKIQERWFPAATEVLLANGWSFPDAISASAAGAKAQIPVLLSTQNSLTPESAVALSWTKPKNTVVVGSGAAIDSSVEALVKVATKQGSTRLDGNSRYATNAMVMSRYFDPATSPGVSVATGQNFPDALVAAALAPAGRPVLLTTSTCTTQEVRSLLEAHAASASRSIVRMGNATSSDAWEVNCANGRRFDQPVPIWTPPYPGAYPAAATDVTGTELRRFIEQYNLLRVGQGFPAVPADHFIVTKCNSDKSLNQVRYMEQTGHWPSDLHAGHCGPSEAAWVGPKPAGYDIHGDSPAQMWWYSKEHRAIMYPAAGDVANRPDYDLHIVFGMAVGQAGAASSAFPTSKWDIDYGLANGTCVRATTVDPTLVNYVPPTGTGRPAPASEMDAFRPSMMPGHKLFVPSTITNVGSARI